MPWAIRQWFPIGSHLFIHVDDTEYNKLYTVDWNGKISVLRKCCKCGLHELVTE